jgi:hypothetical protein
MWGETNVWHMQDDVVICSDFKKQTEELESVDVKIICAFTCKYDDDRNPGLKEARDHMWYSFPCLRINSKLTKLFAEWVDMWVWHDPQFGFYVRQKKGDDYLFRIYIENYFPREPVLNLAPNLVDHVDYLIGGTIVNPQRDMKNVRSMYWDEPQLVEELKEAIDKYDNDNR